MVSLEIPPACLYEGVLASHIVQAVNSLTKITRMSSDMALSILRWFSANCSSWDLYWPYRAVTPSTITPHIRTKLSFQIVQGASIFHHIMQETTSYRYSIQLEFWLNTCHLYGVNDIRLAWFAVLTTMAIHRRLKRLWTNGHPLLLNILLLKRQLLRLLNSLLASLLSNSSYHFILFLRIWKLDWNRIKNNSELPDNSEMFFYNMLYS